MKAKVTDLNGKPMEVEIPKEMESKVMDENNVSIETTTGAVAVTTEGTTEEPKKEVKFGEVIDAKIEAFNGVKLLEYLEGIPDKYVTHIIISGIGYEKITGIKNASLDAKKRFYQLRDECSETYIYQNKPASRREVDTANSNVYKILVGMINKLSDEADAMRTELNELKSKKCNCDNAKNTGVDPTYHEQMSERNLD